MDSMKFLHILEADITNVVRMVVSQMSNDPKRTSKFVTDNLKKHKLELLLGPSQWTGLTRGPGTSQNFLQKNAGCSQSPLTSRLYKEPSGNNFYENKTKCGPPVACSMVVHSP